MVRVLVVDKPSANANADRNKNAYDQKSKEKSENQNERVAVEVISEALQYANDSGFLYSKIVKFFHLVD